MLAVGSTVSGRFISCTAYTHFSSPGCDGAVWCEDVKWPDQVLSASILDMHTEEHYVFSEPALTEAVKLVHAQLFLP